MQLEKTGSFSATGQPHVACRCQGGAQHFKYFQGFGSQKSKKDEETCNADLRYVSTVILPGKTMQNINCRPQNRQNVQFIFRLPFLLFAKIITGKGVRSALSGVSLCWLAGRFGMQDTLLRTVA